jgi:hypothetical protein
MGCIIMNSLIHAVVLAAVLAVPVASFAQSNQPPSRAQVRSELAQIEKAGYDAHANDVHYPAKIQAAEARVAVQSGTAESENTSFGGANIGSMNSGAPKAIQAGKLTYSHH